MRRRPTKDDIAAVEKILGKIKRATKDPKNFTMGPKGFHLDVFYFYPKVEKVIEAVLKKYGVKNIPKILAEIKTKSFKSIGLGTSSPRRKPCSRQERKESKR